MKRTEADYSRPVSPLARQQGRILRWLGLGSGALPVIVLVAALSHDVNARRQEIRGQVHNDGAARSGGSGARQVLAPKFRPIGRLPAQRGPIAAVIAWTLEIELEPQRASAGRNEQSLRAIGVSDEAGREDE